MLLLKCSILLAILLPCLAEMEEKFKKELMFGKEADYHGHAPDLTAYKFSGFKDNGHNGTKRLDNTGRIVDVAPIQSFPWQASIQVLDDYYGERYHYCGGAILNERWIVTAGYCVAYYQDTPEYIAIFTGSKDLRQDGYLSSVHQIIVHRRYDSYTYEHDIAWVRLENDLDLSERNRRAISFPSQGVPPPKRKLEVSGWGEIYYEGPWSSMLQSATVNIVRLNQCRDIYEDLGWDIDRFIDDGKICAGEHDRNICYGNFGAPLVKKRTYSSELLGIASDFDSCGEYNAPGIFTSMSEYSDLTACVIGE